MLQNAEGIRENGTLGAPSAKCLDEFKEGTKPVFQIIASVFRCYVRCFSVEGLCGKLTLIDIREYAELV